MELPDSDCPDTVVRRDNVDKVGALRALQLLEQTTSFATHLSIVEVGDDAVAMRSATERAIPSE